MGSPWSICSTKFPVQMPQFQYLDTSVLKEQSQRRSRPIPACMLPTWILFDLAYLLPEHILDLKIHRAASLGKTELSSVKILMAQHVLLHIASAHHRHVWILKILLGQLLCAKSSGKKKPPSISQTVLPGGYLCTVQFSWCCMVKERRAYKVQN